LTLKREVEVPALVTFHHPTRTTSVEQSAFMPYEDPVPDICMANTKPPILSSQYDTFIRIKNNKPKRNATSSLE